MLILLAIIAQKNKVTKYGNKIKIEGQIRGNLDKNRQKPNTVGEK